jgi:hypothetical protein
VVADSKRVFARTAAGNGRLESSALTFLGLSATRPAPETGAQMLALGPQGCCAAREELDRHPWYAELAPRLPVHVDRGRLELQRERLRRAMRAERVELVDAGVRVVPAGELNRSYERTGNKSATVWERLAPLLRHLWDAHAAEGLELFVDRQGGRWRYRALLARLFPEAELAVERESEEHSEYRLRAEDGSDRRLRLTFAERAESRAFGVALASCLAKYTRELCMAAFNAYFARLQPELRPTAGYAQDGRRWLAEAAPALERSGLPRAVLVRER